VEEGDAVTDGVETAPTALETLVAGMETFAVFGAEVETTGTGAVVLGTETLGAETFGGDTFGGETFGGETFGGDTFGGETFGGAVEPTGVDTPATGADTFGGFGTGAAGILCP
jgi:hypothetical protein